MGCSSSRPGEGEVRIRVLSLDLEVRDTGSFAPDNIIGLIQAERPDVVALQSIRREDASDIMASLSDQSGMAYAFGETHGSGIVRFGNGFLTRFPILEERNTVWTGPSPGGILHLVLEIGGEEISVMSADPRRPDTGVLTMLLDAVRSAGTRPRIVAMGFGEDLSAAHDSLAGALSDGWEAIGSGDGPTFPAVAPSERRDRVYFSPAAGQRSGFRPKSIRVLKTRVSDHAPLLIELELAVP
jgi:endonuclease/exonuclease/phosphatase family metal-dependent hydrolase